MSDFRAAPPPNGRSLKKYFETEWLEIFDLWDGGFRSDIRILALSDELEAHRARIFDKMEAGTDFDWENDWFATKVIHQHNLDRIANNEAYYSGLKEFWLEWQDDINQSNRQLVLESVRSLVILNGAAIIAGITVLTNGASTATGIAVVIAKTTILTSSISLVCIASGFAINVELFTHAANRSRTLVIGHPPIRRLNALPRFLRKYIAPKLRWANWFIYGSFAVFAFNALISAVLFLIN